jgi:hypothetical protein
MELTPTWSVHWLELFWPSPFSVYYKSKSVDRKSEALSAKLNDASNNLKLTEDDLNRSKRWNSTEQKFDQKQSNCPTC